MKLLNGKKVNLGNEFPSLDNQIAKSIQNTINNKKHKETSDILERTKHGLIKNKDKPNMVVMVSTKKGKKKGKKRGNKAYKNRNSKMNGSSNNFLQNKSFTPVETPHQKAHKNFTTFTEAKPSQKAIIRNNRHKLWDNYYESLFFISNVNILI